LDAADDIDQTSIVFKDARIKPKNADQAALTGLIQALYAAAEFQFVR